MDNIYVAKNSWGPDGQEHQIPLKMGDEIEVIHQDDSGWWYGQNLRSGIEGYFPGSFVAKKIQPPPQFRGRMSQRSMHGRAIISQLQDSQNTTRTNTAERQEDARIAFMRDNRIEQADPVLQVWDADDLRKLYTGRRQDAAIQSLKVNQHSKTIYCVVGHYQGYISAITSLWLGYVAFKWSSNGVGPWMGIKFEDLCGVYCILAGLLTMAYERKWGVKLQHVTMYRVWGYLAAGVIPLLSVSTMYVSWAYAMTALTYWLAVHYGESGFKFRKGRGGDNSSYWSKLKKWFVDAVQENKWQKYMFAFIWIVINIAVYIDIYTYWAEFVEDNPTAATFWLSHAKGWGTILDINMTMILMPVSKNLIRIIYDYSTDQTRMARCLRWLLILIPLDKAIQFHKLQAGLVFVAAIGHSFSHYNHYADVPATYGELFGPGVWFTGVLLLTVTHWIFSTALDVIRKEKFEIFYYTHHIFIGYYAITLFHGAGWWNPNFWKYLLVPGTIYFLERVAREYHSTRGIGVVSATMMNANKTSGDVRVLCLELQKMGPLSSYKEGQYVDVKCPMVSKFQWHPFTISSAPQKPNVTLHIRDQGEGTWTNRVYKYMLTMAGNGTRVSPRQRMNNQPMVNGPDGRPLFQINGPHPAPTQHLGEYHVAMVVGGGIGVTPVRATLYSIVHRFKYGLGMSYPDHAYLYWLVRHKDLRTYMFMMRTIKEVSDELYDLKHKNPEAMKNKSFQFHVCITSNPRSTTPYKIKPEEENADDLSLWGSADRDPNSKNHEVLKKKSPLDEWKIFKALWWSEESSQQLGDYVTVKRFYDKDPNDPNSKKERMNWNKEFVKVKEKHRGMNCGVMYCGPRAVADILKKTCGVHTDYNTTRFIFHKENF